MSLSNWGFKWLEEGPWDLRTVSNGMKIQKQRKNRTAIWP